MCVCVYVYVCVCVLYMFIALSGGAVEYADWTTAEG